MIFEEEVWFVAGEFVFVVYRTIRFLESSEKSCENLLFYACKKGVPVMRDVRMSGFSLRVIQGYTVRRDLKGLEIVVGEEEF